MLNQFNMDASMQKKPRPSRRQQSILSFKKTTKKNLYDFQAPHLLASWKELRQVVKTAAFKNILPPPPPSLPITTNTSTKTATTIFPAEATRTLCEETLLPMSSTLSLCPLVGTSASLEERSSEGRFTCNSCLMAFEDKEEQVLHFKSPLHVFNLKRRLKALEPVETEEEMILLTPGDASDESSSDSDDTEGEMDGLNNVGSPYVHFVCEEQLIKIYREVLYSHEQMKDYREESKSDSSYLQALISSTFKWTVILLQSGRFSAGVFERDQPLCHKSFQRYTSRRKQGGSQAAKDAQGGSAIKSAGATLRRYNEMALKEDITNLLTSWSAHLDSSDLIFLSVPKRQMNIFFSGNAPLLKRDSRIRKVPFGTLRPTFEEVCRIRSCLAEATFEPFDLETFVSTPPPPAPKESSSSLKDDSVESTDVAVDVVQESPPVYRSAIYLAVQENDMARLQELLQDDHNDVNELTSDISSPLHLAASMNRTQMIQLLLEHGANPELLDLRHRPPYYLCNSKECRDAFRRYRGKHPLQWNYDAAKIPDALTDALTDLKKQKLKEKKKRAKLRSKEEKELEAEALLARQELERLALEKNKCTQCRRVISGAALERMDYKYCSTLCVTEHKRILLRDAALARFSA